MFKRLLFLLALLIGLPLGLQFFAGWDFTQVTQAWGKYQQSNDSDAFMKDVSLILQGKKIREGALPLGKYADQLMYRWTDEFGEVHVAARPPKSGNYETIRVGDLKFQIQDGMSQEEIQRAIGAKDKD